MYSMKREDDYLYGNEPFFIKFGCSNLMICLRLLNRMEPFTSMHIKANTHLDEPDRNFKSISQEWKNVQRDKQANGELTPEFFFMPEFLRNHNLNNFGLSQLKQYSVNDLKLPRWAKSEHDFVRVQRELLEVEIVRLKLKTWIDMLFGPKQDDRARKNIYFQHAYEKFWGNSTNLAGLEQYQIFQAVSSIREFMQMPSQLFRVPLDKVKASGELNEEDKDDIDQEESATTSL
mmetsp:Transcript_15194/g.11049  ORF Transcript_15194/g.11049 Transcript_15194/m.11049 type:complete len:232 (+) Transcript_15194:334-1029(+)